MALHDCIKQDIFDNGDDDDGPAIFRRNNTTSKKSQLGSALKKSSSEDHDRSPRRSLLNQSLNGENSNNQKRKAASSDSSSPKHDLKCSSQQKSVSDTKKSCSNKPQDKAENSDDSDDNKPLSFGLNVASAGEQKRNSLALDNSHGEAVNSDDSDDDKPLCFRVSAASAGGTKSNSLLIKKEPSSPMAISSPSQKAKEIIKQSSDSEDEIPLSTKLQQKSRLSTPIKRSTDSDDEKPLASKFQRNGHSKRDSSSDMKMNKGISKRPLADVHRSDQSSCKKAKLSVPSAPVKGKHESTVKTEDDDHILIAQRTKKLVSSNNQSNPKKVIKKVISSSKKVVKKTNKAMETYNYSKSLKVPPGSGEGQKWTILEHSGVIFPPPYKPHGVKMLYNGQPVDLTAEQEEVATMFAVMKDTEFATKKTFLDNFWNDWKVLLGRNHVIKKFDSCDFTPIYEWHLKEKEKKKQMSTEEKKALKEEKLKQEEKYMWAMVDGVKEKVGNFRVEPPGLFRGRGEHPKMGKLKRRIRPRDITINIGKDAPLPDCPIPGERWKEIKHDNTVTWLAFWNDPINPKEFKYVFLAASSSLKGQSDKEKYEKARKLKDYIHNIRATYTKDFTSKDETKRQIAVATYLIDKLALRAGNEKDDDEADTVGCCTLKVENVTLVPPNKLQFDFLGKDSIRYFNTVEVELPVYKAIGEFRTKGKKDGGDNLFDMLDTSKLNAHLKELMPGLTAKVFRTYNASITLDDMLNKETRSGTVPEKIAVYQSANKEVAIICNHQRSVSKSHDAQMSRLDEKISELKSQYNELKVDLGRARKGKPPLKDAEGKTKKNLSPEALEKKLAQLNAKIEKIELDRKVKEDLKTVALGTSKINYLDPRISVSWCKRHEVPIEKIFNKSLLAKFAWAMDCDPQFRF